MLQLYRPAGDWGLPSLSPFCVKLETWLRLAEIPYEAQAANPAKAPKGKVPYVEIDGELMGDSQLIVERLSVERNVELDAGLSDRERALARAVRRMLEEGTYWAIVHARWLDDAGWAVYRPVFGALLPAAARPLAVPIIRRRVQQSAWAHGAGRHDDPTQRAMGAADLAAVAELAVGPFFFGDRPRSIDATIYGMVASAARFPHPGPVAAAAELPPLAALAAAVEARCWPDAG